MLNDHDMSDEDEHAAFAWRFGLSREVCERLARLRAQIHERGEVNVEQLSQALNCSADEVRRDVATLRRLHDAQLEDEAWARDEQARHS